MLGRLATERSPAASTSGPSRRSASFQTRPPRRQARLLKDVPRLMRPSSATHLLRDGDGDGDGVRVVIGIAVDRNHPTVCRPDAFEGGGLRWGGSARKTHHTGVPPPSGIECDVASWPAPCRRGGLENLHTEIIGYSA